MQDADTLEAQVREEYRTRLPSQPPAKDFLLVLGPTSSGKTTTVDAFLQRHAGWRRAYDSALMSSERFLAYLEGTASSPVDYVPFEIEALLVRFLQNLDCDRRCIADQSLHSIWAYARAAQSRGLISDNHYQTIVALALTLDRLASPPGLVVHFRCDPTEALERLAKRNRPHELRLCTPDFLAALDQAYAALIRDLENVTRVVTLDTSGISQSEVVRRFEEIVEAHTGEKPAYEAT